jgi:hypothetical protein
MGCSFLAGTEAGSFVHIPVVRASAGSQGGRLPRIQALGLKPELPAARV